MARARSNSSRSSDDRPVVVVGAGGLGRETAGWLERAGHEVIGYLDDDEDRHGTQVAGLPILGNLSWLEGSDNGRGAASAVAVGAPRARRQIVTMLTGAGHPTVTVVDPAAVVGPRNQLGDGTIVAPGATVTCDATIGVAAVLSVGCGVHHDGRVGDYAFIGPGVQLSGNVTLGEGAWIGVGASVIQGITIGEGTVVGAGAAVIDDLPANVMAVGVPAQVIATSDQEW